MACLPGRSSFRLRSALPGGLITINNPPSNGIGDEHRELIAIKKQTGAASQN